MTPDWLLICLPLFSIGTCFRLDLRSHVPGMRDTAHILTGQSMMASFLSLPLLMATPSLCSIHFFQNVCQLLGHLSITPSIHPFIHPSIHLPTLLLAHFICAQPVSSNSRREDLYPLFLLETSPILVMGLYVSDLILPDFSAQIQNTIFLDFVFLACNLLSIYL